MSAVISLGAGVQSSTLLLMAAAGEFDVTPELAIFADTGWEPAAVYEHLNWLEREVAGTIEVVRVTGGDLRADTLRVRRTRDGERTYLEHQPPAFTTDSDGRKGMMARHCTRDFKVRPIQQELRRRGYNKTAVEMWLGISLDEVQRMKPATVPWIENVYPLIDRRMTRSDCLAWAEAHGLPPPPKLACIGCPYHSDARWRQIRSNPDEWADAVAFDRELRQAGHAATAIDGDIFLHRQRVPLDEVDLSTPEDRGQLALLDAENFGAECEGMCGV